MQLRQLQFPQENITRPIVYLNTEKWTKQAQIVYILWIVFRTTTMTTICRR